MRSLVYSVFVELKRSHFILIKTVDLFSGIGGAEVAARALGGFKTELFCEIDPFCQTILKKNYPEVPIHGDIKTLNRAVIEELGIRGVDLIIGTYPCQSVSIAGKKAGLSDIKKSGLFHELWRVVTEIRPRFVLLENVRNHLNKDFDIVLEAIASSNYDCFWKVISAREVGACHLRERLFVICFDQALGITKELIEEVVNLPILGRENLPYLMPPEDIDNHWINASYHPHNLTLQKQQLRALGNSLSPHQAIVPLNWIKYIYVKEV